jgi:hypothetical protein
VAGSNLYFPEPYVNSLNNLLFSGVCIQFEFGILIRFVVLMVPFSIESLKFYHRIPWKVSQRTIHFFDLHYDQKYLSICYNFLILYKLWEFGDVCLFVKQSKGYMAAFHLFWWIPSIISGLCGQLLTYSFSNEITENPGRELLVLLTFKLQKLYIYLFSPKPKTRRLLP